MDKTSSEKISTYFSNRIEEIKEGTFIPSYDQVKDLPEFSGISRDEIIIARNGWYKQTFHMNFNKFSSRLTSGLSEEEYDRKRARLKGKRNNGFCFLIIGVLLIVWFSYGTSMNWYYGLGALGGIATIAFGIILMVIGIILIMYYNNKLP